MCNECWKEFKGWCKSFTWTEVLLALLEALLLIICIIFIVFLIMHLIVCSSGDKDKFTNTSTTQDSISTTSKQVTEHLVGTTTSTTHHTVPPGVKCTWEPSKKTLAPVRYYENGIVSTQPTATEQITTDEVVFPTSANGNDTGNRPIRPAKIIPKLEDVDELALDDQSDGEEITGLCKTFVLALVKLKPPEVVTFGCTLTAITEHWTLTAASCIEAVEEVDSLDNFVMVEGYGCGGRGRSHGVADVQPHPLYQGANRSYDVMALRSEEPLRTVTAVDLPTLADYLLLTVGERFTILGFGPFRSVEGESSSTRRVRSVSVYSVPRTACGAGGWSVRHLFRGRADRQGACGSGPLCAGVLYARGSPCNYCAGTPLLRARKLLGIMSDSRECGVACEPALFVNLALVRDWVDMLINPD